MKNIFIRGGMSPFESFPASHILLKNSIGQNVGNFLYLNGVLRNIVHEDTNVTPTYYKWRYTDQEIAEINDKYDCFLIPLADAFRDNFRAELNGYTNVVKKSKIPCVVTGVGIRAPLEERFDHAFSFDEDVKNFVNAVLEKSKIIGVRGERTGAYLKHLGFREEKDYTVIGCPSLYIHGPKLHVRDTTISQESFVCYNTTSSTPDNIVSFVERSAAEFASAQFIPQTIKELKLLYLGEPFRDGNRPPTRITDKIFQSDQTCFFLNIPTWIEFMEKADFNFGARLHGNVAAMLAGTPSLLFPKDARVSELAEYHNMTRYPVDQINDQTDIWELIANADFKSAEKVHYANYTHFIDFLQENGLDPYRQEPDAVEELPFETRMKGVQLEKPVTSIVHCSMEEVSDRLDSYYLKKQEAASREKERAKKERERKKEENDRRKKEYECLKRESENLRKENERIKKESERLKKEKAMLEDELNHSFSPRRLVKKVRAVKNKIM
ncbi:MAG: polysaccharide pyruvyl transferase family protein [Lachnospiraceae bacterium]|nr:polysaccharide pyruvyl transferase family protein [Lachnospiraceae bacterium]